MKSCAFTDDAEYDLEVILRGLWVEKVLIEVLDIVAQLRRKANKGFASI